MLYTSRSYKVFRIFNYIFMVFIIFICFFPYLHVVAKAFNTAQDTMLGGITFVPRVFTMNNFKEVFSSDRILSGFTVSVGRSVLGTLLALIVQFSAAYALTKKGFKGKKFISYFLLIPMFFSAGLIPTYIWYVKLKLLNNFLVYILPGAFYYFNMIVIRTYIDSTISPSLEESAKMDGANEIRIFFNIIIPLCKPIIAAMALFSIVGHWNDWMTTLYYVTKKNLFTLQYQLMQIIRESEMLQRAQQEAISQGRLSDLQGQVQQLTTPESLMAAQIVIITLPVLLVYPFLQKYFVAGLMIGGVKE